MFKSEIFRLYLVSYIKWNSFFWMNLDWTQGMAAHPLVGLYEFCLPRIQFPFFSGILIFLWKTTALLLL